jgi:putative membrane protein
MKKTLILVVDRDDDFGTKAGVETPVIGYGGCSAAATALGVADPEDSDVNTLFAAMNIYRELKDDGKDAEIALLCGDRKVGHKSDAAVIDELAIVVNEIEPDRAILVSDGAEDEYVYPIISSRIQVDSVRKVFVKQSPGLEGTVYIISKMLEDSEKRKRFIGPIGWIITLIGLMYFLPAFFIAIGNPASADYNSVSGSLVLVLIGILLLSFAYNAADTLRAFMDKWVSRVRSGSVVVMTGMLSVTCIIIGLVLGAYAALDLYTNSIVYMGLWFVSNALWPISFGLLIYMLGEAINDYLTNRVMKRGFLVGSINLIALSLVLSGIVDCMILYLALGQVSANMIIFEFIVGIVLAVMSSVISRSIKRHVICQRTEEDALL